MQEQVEDVEIERDSSVDVLLGGDAVRDHVRVEDDEEREEDGASHADRQVHRRRREEQLQRTKRSAQKPNLTFTIFSRSKT